jgi:triphosphoribosyl-dephospho-CoA synthetase
MAIAGLILLLLAAGMFAVGLLGVMPAGAALGIFLLVPAVFALGMSASEHELHLRHRRVR